MNKLSHIGPQGQAQMVDVSAKPQQTREAVARGELCLAGETLRLIQGQQIVKGNVFATARVAGILAAKKTWELIPMCHPLPLSYCEVDFAIPENGDRVVITSTVRTTAQTGVEMEALAAVTIAALTIYDMCKAVDQQMRIANVKLVSKIKG
jgi:cyclic pyranopterin monophosphate synthase